MGGATAGGVDACLLSLTPGLVGSAQTVSAIILIVRAIRVDW